MLYLIYKQNKGVLKMKMQGEYEKVKSKISSLNMDAVAEYKKHLIATGEYTDFNTRFSWDLLRAAIGTSAIVGWYDTYKCNDSHITTLAIKVCKDLKLI